MRQSAVKAMARTLLEPCDPARQELPSPTSTEDWQRLTQAERRGVDLLVARTRRLMGLRAHRRLPFLIRPFVAMRWGCFNAFGPEFAPFAWMTGAYVRDVPRTPRRTSARETAAPMMPAPVATADLA